MQDVADRKQGNNFILGITLSHDAGAALILDGKVLSAVNEERYTRKKQQMGFPVHSIKEVMRYAGIGPDQIFIVAIGAKHLSSYPSTNNDLSEDDGSYRRSVSVAEKISSFPAGRNIMSMGPAVSGFRKLNRIASRKSYDKIVKQLRDLDIQAPVKTYDHHDCHLASAYFASGKNQCLVISNDGFGDGLCSKVAIGKNGKLQELNRTSFADSLGIIYGYATDLCGFRKIHHAGKTTGLAARGDATATIDIFREAIGFNNATGRYESHLGIFRQAHKTLQRQLSAHTREDIAAGIQAITEELLVAQLKHYLTVSGMSDVALAGGVHANVRANQCLAEIDNIQSLFVFPNMGDGGLALGAAYLAWSERPEKTLPIAIDSAYLGTSIEGDSIEELLKTNQLDYYKPSNMAHDVADLLAKKHIVARCSGPMEYGPRALGNRSILYDATDPTANDWLNARLGRSEFMPFAPVLRDVDVMDMISGDLENTKISDQFMTVTHYATEKCQNEAPACVHVDNTLRPQILKRTKNPEYYDIITSYKEKTGLSILVNTSFNMHEEPIICDAKDAIRAFLKSGLDNLALGPFIVNKPA